MVTTVSPVELREVNVASGIIVFGGPEVTKMYTNINTHMITVPEAWDFGIKYTMHTELDALATITIKYYTIMLYIYVHAGYTYILYTLLLLSSAFHGHLIYHMHVTQR